VTVLRNMLRNVTLKPFTKAPERLAHFRMIDAIYYEFSKRVGASKFGLGVAALPFHAFSA